MSQHATEVLTSLLASLVVALCLTALIDPHGFEDRMAVVVLSAMTAAVIARVMTRD